MSHGRITLGLVIRVAVVLTARAGSILAQADNICDPGEAPDIIVGEILGSRSWGTVDGISAYSFGTDSCNIGTCQANWFALSPLHPVIAQNLFRLKDGRLEQIGQSWVKHGFGTIDDKTCSPDCLEAPADGFLGVNCSDVYFSGLNGTQQGMGPKSEVRAWNGVFPWPPTDVDLTGDAIYKRLQVHAEDLDPALNAGAQYFVEAQYVTRDDATGGNQNNNASHRPVDVTIASDGTFELQVSGGTAREIPAIFAWQSADPEVWISALELTGRYYVGSRATDLGDGTWRYEYAVHNLNADGAQGFVVPTSGDAAVSNIGFHDVDYHSGEPWDGTDWPGTFDPQAGVVSWAVIAQDDFANVLRWGTLYNFRFDCDRPPVAGMVELTPFVNDARAVTAGPGSVDAWLPQACDDDGVCEPAEDCNNCPGDCTGMPISFCGDGICDPASGEDCESCSRDCNGQRGNPAGRFCCGDGDGQNPVACSDPRCTTAGFACSTPCCGDGTCNFGEGRCSCAPDCGFPAHVELVCGDGSDDDCDAATDCDDLDCCLDVSCADGIDADGDSVAECDCDDGNATAWSMPGEARDLTLAHDTPSGVATLSWTAPVDGGASAVSYAVLRSGDESDFVAAAVCLSAADPLATVATDVAAPPSGGVFHYLVRAENACPAGAGLGDLGSSSAGAFRDGRACP
ncbi:MAG TPA: hypothetical protein VD788_02325 [Candidatus Polarisedimenticolaceae bacterium]|nr:hypothetical protein [Candidatus Polarisedimenticolaceae bacterium]